MLITVAGMQLRPRDCYVILNLNLLIRRKGSGYPLHYPYDRVH